MSRTAGYYRTRSMVRWTVGLSIFAIAIYVIYIVTDTVWGILGVR